MKKINFANIAKKSKVKLSSKITIGFVLLTLSLVTFLQINQWNKLKSIEEEKSFHTKKVNKLSSVVEEKNELEKEETFLKNKLEKIERVQNNPHTHFEIFNTINTALQHTGSLESLNLLQKKLEITILCQDIKEATRFMKTMIELPSISSLQIVSIHPKAHQLCFKLLGNLT